MGRVRTKTVKRAAKVLLEKHYLKLTNDFHINKKILSEVAKVPTKSLRNKIAGFATHLMKRIQRGPVKGISLKVQEEQRQRRLDWVPKQSQININKVSIDNETNEMIKRRFGEDFATKISGNIEIKVPEAAKKKDNRGPKRNPKEPREGRPKKREQKPNQPQQQKQEEKPATTEPPKQEKAEEKQGAKRQGRRRGNREGQQS